MQIICTLLQTDNHASTSLLSFYRPDALPAANQQRQSTKGKSTEGKGFDTVSLACKTKTLIPNITLWLSVSCGVIDVAELGFVTFSTRRSVELCDTWTHLAD